MQSKYLNAAGFQRQYVTCACYSRTRQASLPAVQLLHSKRQLLQSAMLLVPLLYAGQATADVSELDRVLPGEPLPAPALPKRTTEVEGLLNAALSEN